MEVKPPASIREIVIPCVRLIKLMTDIDATASFLILLGWSFYTIQEMLYISLESRIATHTYRFLTNTASYAEAVWQHARLWMRKWIIRIANTMNYHYRDTLVRNIK